MPENDFNTNKEALTYVVTVLDTKVLPDLETIKTRLFIARDGKRPIEAQVDENQQRITEISSATALGKFRTREIMLIIFTGIITAVLSAAFMLLVAKIFKIVL